MQMDILESGERETFKAAVHGVALALTLVMDAYNLAAWVHRRQRHLAFNALIYSALAVFEYRHVVHHRDSALEAAARLAAAAADAVTPKAPEQRAA